MPVETPGGKQYVQFMRDGVFGVDAKTGKYLWRYDRTVQRGANIMTPVVSGNRVFTAGGMSGGGLVELTVDGDKVAAKEVYFDKALGAGIGGAVLVDGHLYGSTRTGLFCADYVTGKVKWAERSVGEASICYADGRLYARGHGGDVALVEATPAEYREKGRFKQPDRSKQPAWAHPVVANGGLYIPDQGVLLYYEVSARKKD
jgi:outer membrane protein assembly factor BamB